MIQNIVISLSYCASTRFELGELQILFKPDNLETSKRQVGNV